ncbi:heavy metal-associated isoprenylated plant protein 16 [Rhodamnia argentea]|uniref:Heavy metal-associated isoprenylated plant protein 16 n=1 Tax=Rhodamnia argentea TaxID=178133 RepID=A0ABM3HN16_9MYRT|nr:heavy metal-associated isoprenylated plant protein 16 [Rhodamnia argentea]
MKQKVVIKVCINDPVSRFCCFNPKRSHSKALTLAAGFPGVQSVEHVDDKDQIVVTGEIDAVNLAALLRKKVGFADIVSVGEVKPPGESKDKPPEKPPEPVTLPYPRQEIVYFCDPCPEPSCWPLSWPL